MKVGLLLPHFGSHATSSRLLDGINEIEQLGFDSVWVRDHVVYRPHEFEDHDITFVDAFSVLSAAAARSDKLILGTATLIPYRHPIQAALQISSLATLAGSDRLLIAWGSGNDLREFAAVAAPGTKRGARLEEHVAVVGELLTGRSVTHHGVHYDFEDVRIAPTRDPIPFWYGGGSARGIERAAQHFAGLLASRIPRSMFLERIKYLNELSDAYGRPRPEVGVVALVSPADTVTAGLAAFDYDRIRAETERRFPGQAWPMGSGIDGVMVAGPPEQISAELNQYADIGVSHFVIDLRGRFDEWERLIRLLSADVLPSIRRQ